MWNFGRSNFKSGFLAVCISMSSSHVANAQTPTPLVGIDLDVLAVVSDGDQDALTYSSRDLAKPGRRDLMMLWKQPFGPQSKPAGEIEVPNSNFSPSGVVVLSRDGSRAHVVDTMSRPEGSTKLNELVPSDKLMSYDISDPSNPHFLGRFDVGRQPRSLDLSGDSRTVVVASKDAERPLTFAAVTPGGLASIRSFSVPGVPKEFDDFSFVQWSPVADIIALHLAIQNQILFLKVIRANDGSVSDLVPFGNPVVTNKYPLAGRFTPDGRHYVSSDVNWGVDVRGYSQVRRGILTLIQVAEDTTAQPRNLVVDLDVTGVSAESLAISPDGQYVAASNIETTGTPVNDPRHNGLALLTLYRLDGSKGQMAKVAEVRYPGLLPQGIVFDAASRYVLVGVNELSKDRAKGGVLVFRLDRSPEPRLIDTGVFLEAAPGVHSIAVSRGRRD